VRYGVTDWDRSVKALRDADAVVVATHVNPDGDAIGSTLAVSLALRSLGKRTYPTWGTPGLKVPLSYRFLPGADTFIQPHEVPEAGVFLAVDCGAGDRLGALEQRALANPCLLNVDHHSGNSNFGKLNIVVPTASSTAELVTHLITDVGVEIDRDIATCLYAGVVTDTGRFQYGNSSPEVLRLAADLLERGVPAVEIAQEVFESAPFGYLKLVGRVLDRAVLDEELRFVYSWLTLSDLDETGVGLDETEKLIDQVRATRSADVAAMFKEQPGGSFRVSLRSKGPTSVGAIARAHGGGGHELAAGFTAASVDDAVAAIADALREGRGA
jgi:bifunctional oligoribonuclease and PAP phosphatase NrnA